MIELGRESKIWPHVRKMLAAGAYVDSANLLISQFGKRENNAQPLIKTDDVAIRVLREFLQNLLFAGRFDSAAQLLWGPEQLWVEQKFSAMIWEQVPEHSETIILGAGSVGKTYTVSAWLFLDYLMDPMWTSLKVVSVTKKHAETNAFSSIQKFAKSSLIPLGLEMTSSLVTANPEDKRQGIQLVAIPKGENGAGRLQGMHPVPRPNHPKLGTQSRIRVLLDEAEEVPQGVWKDIDNVLTSKEGPDKIKIVAAANPRKREGNLLVRAEPKKGWSQLDEEYDIHWRSKLGWNVLRFDAAKCENVIEKKTIYPGLQTWDGYRRYLLMEGSPEYWTMARGMPPPQGSIPTVMSPMVVDKSKGTFIFTGATIYISATDLAFTGVDSVVTGIGKYGVASGWRDWEGNITMFDKARVGLEVVDVFEMEKKPTPELSLDIIQNAKLMNIPPTRLALDRTGNGQGVYDLVKGSYGNIFGISFGEGPTNNKILEDDILKPKDRFHKVNSEMAFAVAYWAEAGFVKFGQKTDLQSWEGEFTDRRYRVRSDKIEVEKKEDYKARTGRTSPDRADVVGMLIHLVRVRHSIRAYIMEENLRKGETGSVSSLDILEGLE